MSTEMQKRRHDYMNHLRVLEYAHRQVVSLLEIHGIGKGTIQALWQTGIDTAEALMACDVDLILAGLRAAGLPLGDAPQAKQVVLGWREQIRRKQDARKGCVPEPLPWENED